MSSFAKWWARLAAVVSAVSMSVFIPVAAWASAGPGAVVVEAARGRRRVSGFGLIGTLCCLVVVVIIVLVLLLLMRNRRPPRPPR